MKFSYLPISFPLAGPPEGAEQVSRWYQLDPAALALVEWWAREGRRLPTPEAMLLASPHASNESDFDFVKSGMSSPQKFVHTLPSVRATSLVQAMQWQGPILCLQKDPYTLSTALEEAFGLLDRWSRIWVLGVAKESSSVYGVGLIELCPEAVWEGGLEAWFAKPDAVIWERVRKKQIT